MQTAKGQKISVPAEMSIHAVRVAAALIEENGLMLLAQRRADDGYGLKWEFPGGKIRSGETPAEALRRELDEELGITGTTGKTVCTVTHTYFDKKVHVELIHCERTEGVYECRVHKQLQWIVPEDLSGYDLLEADKEMIQPVIAYIYSLKDRT